MATNGLRKVPACCGTDRAPQPSADELLHPGDGAVPCPACASNVRNRDVVNPDAGNRLEVARGFEQPSTLLRQRALDRVEQLAERVGFGEEALEAIAFRVECGTVIARG